MAEAGQALLGIGMGVGERRAMDAVEHAIESPLLETSLDGARSILLSVTGGADLSLWEVNEAAKAVAEAAHPDANIIFGAMVDEKVEDQCWVTIVATGYGDRPQFRAGPRSERSDDRIPADHEPRVRRSREPRAPRRLGDVDVPDCIPRGSLLPCEGGSRRRPFVTAQAGVDVLRAGGNAVDAAVACVLTSFVAESPPHGTGRGRLHARPHVRGRGPPARLLRRRARQGADNPEPRGAGPDRRDVRRGRGPALQRGTIVLRARTARQGNGGVAGAFGTMSLADLTAGPARAAREGVEVTGLQGFLFSVLEPILRSTPESEAIYAPGGTTLRPGDTDPAAQLGDLLERLGAEGPDFLYTGDAGRAASAWVRERGGLLTEDDLATYEVVEREPVRVTLPRARGADQPAAVVGWHPDRGRAGDVPAHGPSRTTCARSPR